MIYLFVLIQFAIILISRTGSNQRDILHQLHCIFAKNSFPNPCPSCAPTTNPIIIISHIYNTASILDFGLNDSHKCMI